jgi:hypothetical protein
MRGKIVQPALVQVDVSAVREQLENIVASNPFLASKKYPAMLRYIVEETLAGRAHDLKERRLGIDVFGRNPDYDTNQDPVVRIAAAEVRKRLTIYYHNHPNQPLEIQIPAGSYFATFTPRSAVLEMAPTAIAPPHRVLGKTVYYAGSALVLLTGLIALWVYARPHEAIDRFWAPFFNSQVPPVICVFTIPRPAPANTPGLTTARQVTQANVLFSHVPFSDVRALVGVARVFRDTKARIDVRSVALTNLSDLRNQPSVVIGAFDNAWTSELTAGLPFSFGRDAATDTQWIVDSKNPTKRQWQVVDTTPTTAAPEDYAVVGRFRHPLTEQIVVVVAGLTQFGTAAAGDFVSSPLLMEELNRLPDRDWDRKNLQIVLATKLVRSEPAPAHIVASHVW